MKSRLIAIIVVVVEVHEKVLVVACDAALSVE